ncbi:hypothetical protein KZZ07_26115 [Mameliella sp. CS4]|uniref:hypothetical protein n=1 Tax=Mameliella sp. CS4 TaxID=2862329 RepID=UPI001C602E43|nr:hypothetical protein [Mameliella sp. CS4]MBW4986015.1 hypothetical protein [Mameliella sp. CS4]
MAPGHAGIQRENGIVVDGRDAWLSQIAFHVVHDVLDAGRHYDAEAIADLAWTVSPTART